MFEFDWKSFFKLNLSEAVNYPLYWYSLLFLLLLILVLYLKRKLKKELIVVFSDEEGDVKITPNAVHELVKKSCDENTEVFCPSTEIKKKGKAFRLNVRIRIKKSSNVKDVRKNLQSKIESAMIQNLNFTNFEGLDLVIKGFQDPKD